MTMDEANEYPVPLPAAHSLSSRLRRAPARQSWPGAGTARIRPGCRIQLARDILNQAQRSTAHSDQAHSYPASRGAGHSRRMLSSRSSGDGSVRNLRYRAL
jgi:hypothetical protein